MRFPHSLGLLYSAFTSFAGFPVNSGESKLMGLAPLGEPRFKNLILNRLIDLKPDGSFRLDLSYFHYCHGLTMTAPRFAELFGGPPRRPETAITQREKDIAASIQVVTGEILARCARHILRTTGQRRLVLAGGVALNCVANARILEDGITDDVWIQPAAGDAGAALGAALFVWHQLLDKPRCVVAGTDRQAGSLLGPSFTDLQVRDTLDQRGASYRCFDDEDTLLDWVAGLLAAGKVVGWFQGRMEFGPRALGNRSILGDPRSPTMQATLNDKIKRRESFRPFAPSILRERTGDWFTVPAGAERPYMLLTTAVKPERRGSVPAVTHVDGSARVQTVDAGRNPRFHRLLERFHNSTGCPLVVNTSFNVRDEPIVATPADAYRCFMATELDALVVENCALLKQDQPSAPRPDSQMATIPPHCQPALCQLRQFGLALGAAGGVGGALLFFRHGRASVAAAVWAVGGAVALTGMVAPARLRSVHRGLTAIGTPIGFLVSRVALTLVHVLLVTPIGVVRRWTGGDGLGRQWERERTTYWEPRDEAPKGDRYFRQY